jgi:glycosyltransferase involved in cell wall biosynthesis
VSDGIRVAVVNLTSGGFSGGYSKYLREVLPRIRSDRRVATVRVASPPGATDAADWRWPVNDSHRGRPMLRQWVRDQAPHVVFVPTARSFDTRSIPLVTMVRNMEPLVIPLSAPTVGERLRNLARYAAAWRSARHATRVIAVSEYVREYLINRWRVDEEQIGLARHGVVVPDAAEASCVAAAAARKGFAIFAAGSIRPARGIEDLLEALESMNHAGRPATLWYAGTPTPGAEAYFAALRTAAEAKGVASRIVWLGNLDAAQMHWCFVNADVFVMTSRVEACPNIVLEAMAAGARSISTRLPPMPEFFCDTASYYEAGDGRSLAAAIEAARQESKEQRIGYRDAGMIRAGSFTWDATAAQTVDELLRAIAARDR